MKGLISAHDPTLVPKAIKLSGFPITQAVLLGEGETGVPQRVIKLSSSRQARTAIQVMQIQTAQCVIVEWDGSDWELINLALEFNRPIFVLYTTEHYQVGMIKNWEEDDF